MIKKWYIDLNNKKRILVATNRGIAIILIINVVLIPGVKRYCKTLLFSVINMMLSIATTDGLSVEFNQGCGGCRLGFDMDFRPVFSSVCKTIYPARIWKTIPSYRHRLLSALPT